MCVCAGVQPAGLETVWVLSCTCEMLKEDLARGSDFIISWLLPHFPLVSWLLSNLWPLPTTSCFFSPTFFLAFDDFPAVAEATQRIVHRWANLRRFSLPTLEDFRSKNQAWTLVLSGVDYKHKRVINDPFLGEVLAGWRSIMLWNIIYAAASAPL